MAGGPSAAVPRAADAEEAADGGQPRTSAWCPAADGGRPRTSSWCPNTRSDETPAGRPPAPSLVDALVAAPARGAVARGALPETARGWRGAVAAAATRKIMTFYPASGGATAFSRQKCHATKTPVKPSLEFLEWLDASAKAGGPAWQLRGDLDLSEAELASILGEDLAKRFNVTSTSLWAGSGGSRTPLHKDDVPALVFQCVGRKRFFLSSRAQVEAAVARGALPEAVSSAGNTEDHCVDGALDDVFGLRDATPAVVDGELAELSPGDCLVLPAGLYHDVESDGGVSMSLTVRFDPDAPPPPPPPSAGGGDLKKFLLRLAMKKAMRDGAAARADAAKADEAGEAAERSAARQ